METKDYLSQIKKIVFSHLNPKEYRIFLFGSRAVKKHRPFSDYDIGITGPQKIDWQTLALINEKLENSNIPVRVDIVDFGQVSPKFKKVATKNIVYL